MGIQEGYAPVEDAVKLVIIVAVIVGLKNVGFLKTDVTLQDVIMVATPLVLIIASQLVWCGKWAGWLLNICLLIGTFTTGFAEELFFRAFGIRVMTKGGNKLTWASVVVLILGFALAHIPGVILRGLEATAIQVGSAVVLGTLLLGVYLNTKSWVLVGLSHSLYNYLCSVTRLNSTIKLSILPVSVGYMLMSLGMIAALVIGILFIKGWVPKEK